MKDQQIQWRILLGMLLHTALWLVGVLTVYFTVFSNAGRVHYVGLAAFICAMIWAGLRGYKDNISAHRAMMSQCADMYQQELRDALETKSYWRLVRTNWFVDMQKNLLEKKP